MRFGVLGTGWSGGDRGEAGRARARGEDGLAAGREREGGRLGFGGRRGGERGLVRRRGRVRRDRRQLRPPGSASLEALEAAGAENLAGKVLIDVANPLDFSHGDAADADGLQRRQPRRADPAGLPGGAGGQGAEHDQRAAVMVEPRRLGDRRRSSSAATTPAPRPRSRSCSRPLAGRRRRRRSISADRGRAGHRDVPAALAAALRRAGDGDIQHRDRPRRLTGPRIGATIGPPG